MAQNPERTDSQAILIVEDEPAISGFIRRGLIFEGYAVDVVADGRTALERLRDDRPGLLILDLMLPGVDGLEICRRVRAAEADGDLAPLPILMLTARDTVQDRVTGLEAGADDYLVKPFAFEELLARVRALLRRTAIQQTIAPANRLSFDDLELDLTARTVHRRGREITLTVREYDLLTLFLRHPNQVLPRGLIMSRVWGDDFFGDSNVLEVTVGNLRRELEAAGEPRLIQTVRGAGYVLRRV
ncbi:MAG: response regulator transcription factor [Thermomicrobiales bacterium]|nr:response regulator transcription factor [Thermomicrobiales bacterium]